MTAAMLMISTADYDRINGLDEEFTVAFNDVDFCLRLRPGQALHNLFTPSLRPITARARAGGWNKRGSAKEPGFEGEQARLKARYGDTLLHDPLL